jgi:hypothetical protein
MDEKTRTDGGSLRGRVGGSPESEGGSSSGSPPAKNPATGWSRVPGDLEVSGETMAIDPEELRDFLSADGTEVNADPAFKENLRETLWKIVEERYGLPDDESEGH